jgi:hypothetical protein
MRRFLAVWGMCLVVTGCTSHRDHAAELAAAKCGSALHDALRLSAFDTGPSRSKVRVSAISGGRRVTGMFAESDGLARSFVCEVAPDRFDKLRGLRVTRLDLGAPPPSSG